MGQRRRDIACLIDSLRLAGPPLSLGAAARFI